MIVPHTPAHPHTSLSLADKKPGRLPNLLLVLLVQATTGTLTGMTLRTTRAGMLRAIMESVALRLKAVFTSIVSILPDDSFEVVPCLSCMRGYARGVWSTHAHVCNSHMPSA
jgi:hypothetical protein